MRELEGGWKITRSDRMLSLNDLYYLSKLTTLNVSSLIAQLLFKLFWETRNKKTKLKFG